MKQLSFLPTPVNRQVLVKFAPEVEQKSAAGLFLAPSADQTMDLFEATVVAFDEKIYTKEVEECRAHLVDVGRTVLLYKSACTKFMFEGEQYGLIKEDHLFGVNFPK